MHDHGNCERCDAQEERIARLEGALQDAIRFLGGTLEDYALEDIIRGLTATLEARDE